MSAIQIIAIGRKLSNIYSELSLPICKKYGINQTCFDILLFFANNPEHNTARDICEVRGIKSGIASVSVEILIENGLSSGLYSCEESLHAVKATVAETTIIRARTITNKFFAFFIFSPYM